MQFDSVFTVKKEIEKETFLREALIEIAKSSEAPIDVVNSQFGEVRESVKEIMVCSAHVESDYTASIGYDRKEQYQTTESKYVTEGGWYTCDGVKRRASHSGTYKVDCIKERTVTDWQPYSGHIAGDETRAEMNGCEGPSIDIGRALNTIKSESIVEEGYAEVDESSLIKVKSSCKFYVEQGIRYPGDHHKDMRSTATVDVENLSCYIVPFYEVEYTYNGKQYKVEGFACGEPIVAAQTPPNDVDIVEVAERDTKKYKIARIAGWGSFAGTYVLSWIMFAIGVYWTWFIPTIALVAAIVLHIVHDKKYSEKLRSLKEDNIKLKREELSRALSKVGYAPLNTAEEEYFNEKKGGKIYALTHQKKKVTGWAILGGVISVILIITSLIGGAAAEKERLHSPDQVRISLVSKTQEYNEDVSTYIYSGCYYVYTEFRISADEVGVDYIKYETTITDKQGKELGTITTALSDMKLGAGGTKTYKTYLEDYQPASDSLFLSLYEADYNDLTFSYKILSIRFSDGGFYNGEYY